MPRPTYAEAARHGSLTGMVLSGKTAEGNTFTLPVGNAATDAVGDQRFFWAGSGRLTIAAAGNFRATLANPTGSGRNLFASRLILFSTVADWVNFYINPTAGLPVTAARPVNNAVIGAAAGVGVLKADTDTLTALSGGTDTGVTLGEGPNRRAIVDLAPFVMSPGVVLGMNANVGAAADATINIFWYERDI